MWEHIAPRPSATWKDMAASAQVSGPAVSLSHRAPSHDERAAGQGEVTAHSPESSATPLSKANWTCVTFDAAGISKTT